jgi:hypothetical protein
VLLSIQAAFALTEVPHTSLEAAIDGDIDDPIWTQALAIRLVVETSPAENMPAPVSTTAYVVRNDTHLFIAFDAEDQAVERIRASFRDRDTIVSEDWVGVSLDTFNDERRSYEFYVNPYGAQLDALYDDVLKNTDNSWDTVWESLGKVHDGGYQVEIAIPFRSLRFANLEDGNAWGIRFLRHYPRDVPHELADTAQDRGRNCTLCQYAKYGFGAIPQNMSRGIEFTPTMSILHSQRRAPGQPFEEDTDYEPGLDFAWNINTQNVLSATLNPDFSQVESDALLLDVNTAFALYYPEKRMFFLEGIDYFQTMENLVFTRNVVNPDAGVKLTGKTGRHTYATFYARDTVTSFLIPGPLYSSLGVIDSESDDFVARYRVDLGKASTAGVLATARQSGDYFNHLAALDGRWVFNEQHSLKWQLMKSETRYPDALAEEHDQPTGKFGGNAVYMIYQFKNRDWDTKLFLRDYSDGIRADMGFLYKAGYDRQGLLVDRFFYGDEDNWWHTIRAHVNWTVTHDSDGTMIRRCNETAVQIDGALQSTLYFNYANLSEYWDGVLYDGHFLEFYGETRPHPQWIVQVASIVGDSIDYANSRQADSVEFAFWVQYKPSDHLTMSTDFAFNELEYRGSRIFTAWINDFRATYQFNLKHRLQLTLQYQFLDRNPAMYTSVVGQTDNDLASRLVYSYKINPRTVFYAGYSDHAIETDQIGSLTSTDRTAFIKFSYGFDY